MTRLQCINRIVDACIHEHARAGRKMDENPGNEYWVQEWREWDETLSLLWQAYREAQDEEAGV